METVHCSILKTNAAMETLRKQTNAWMETLMIVQFFKILKNKKQYLAIYHAQQKVISVNSLSSYAQLQKENKIVRAWTYDIKFLW